jgi:hypothetical protein
MLSGFFAKESTYAPYLIPFKYLSLFKWGYQILMFNEFNDGKPLTCSNYPDKCDILSDLSFPEAIGVSYACTVAVTLGFGIVAYILLHNLVKIKL